MLSDLEQIKNVKGTKDFLPNEQLIRNYITTTFKQVFELYGFLPLETPILCTYDLLSSKYAGGSEILKEVYKLTDQGKRDLGLRYDLTVPFCKVIATTPDLLLPFRRYEIGKVFRDGPVKIGRSREFYQCDIDVCGLDGNQIETEIFDMILTTFKRLGLPVEIVWNNRKFLNGLLLEIGIKTDKLTPVITAVDKLEKVGKQSVVKELLDMGLQQSVVTNLFEMLGLTMEQLNAKFAGTQNILLSEGLKEINNTQTLVMQMGLGDYIRFTPFLARGLDIYTGTVWEILDKTGRISSSLGGGGRYDNIITNFIADGKMYPAVGTSFGLEPIFELIKMGENSAINNTTSVYIYPFELVPAVYDIAKSLRENNISCVVEYGNIKLKKALPWAEKNGINNVLIIGEDEINNNVVTYKNLSRSTQETMSLTEFMKLLKE